MLAWISYDWNKPGIKDAELYQGRWLSRWTDRRGMALAFWNLRDHTRGSKAEEAENRRFQVAVEMVTFNPNFNILALIRIQFQWQVVLVCPVCLSFSLWWYLHSPLTRIQHLNENMAGLNSLVCTWQLSGKIIWDYKVRSHVHEPLIPSSRWFFEIFVMILLILNCVSEVIGTNKPSFAVFNVLG